MKRLVLLLVSLALSAPGFAACIAGSTSSLVYPGSDPTVYRLIVGGTGFTIFGDGLPCTAPNGETYIGAFARNAQETAAKNAMLAVLLQAKVPGNPPVGVFWAVTPEEAETAVGGQIGLITTIHLP